MNDLTNNFLENYITEDKTVFKFIHEDESETAIKITKSLSNKINPILKTIEEHHSDRNKYSIFISSSRGCFMKCKFCHLTLKNAKHVKLLQDQVLDNLKQAIEFVYNERPEISQKYVKLSWMGMGDALNKPEMVEYVTFNLLDWIFEKKYALGLDGVDLSTVFPRIKNHNWINIFQNMNEKLKQYKINPVYQMDNVEYTNNQYQGRNPFRLFYSIESVNQNTRDYIVPNAELVNNVVPLLQKYEDNGKYTLIFHHLIIENLNDGEKELEGLADWMNNNFPNNELRILRYNFCNKSSYKESEKFYNQIKFLSDKLKFIKVQISPGSEVQAACGQFIVKQYVDGQKINANKN